MLRFFVLPLALTLRKLTLTKLTLAKLTLTLTALAVAGALSSGCRKDSACTCERTQKPMSAAVITWSCTRLPALRNETFDVDVLRFIYAGLTVLPTNAFGAFRVSELHLQGNKLRDKISPCAFCGRESARIRHLDLSWCNISSLPARVFRPLHQLENLSLARNAFLRIPDDVFHNLTQLKRLCLSENPIRFLSPSTFRNQLLLLELDIGYCRLGSLSDALFHGLFRLQFLDIRGNALHQLPVGTFRDLMSLLVLQVGHNRMTELRADTFEGLLSLETLLMEEGRVRRIDPTSFRPLRALRRLQLSNNRMRVLGGGVLSYVPQLEILQLDGIGLEELPHDLSKLQQLVQLDLSYNRLHDMPHCAFIRMASLREVNVRANPWHCDCRLYWLRGLRVVLRGKWNVGDGSPFIDGRCESPTAHRGHDTTQWTNDTCLFVQEMCPLG